jgi:hypothetical protein
VSRKCSKASRTKHALRGQDVIPVAWENTNDVLAVIEVYAKCLDNSKGKLENELEYDHVTSDFQDGLSEYDAILAPMGKCVLEGFAPETTRLPFGVVSVAIGFFIRGFFFRVLFFVDIILFVELVMNFTAARGT